MQIITIPNPLLRKRSQKIKLADLKTPEMQKFIEDLAKIMKEDNGIGIAAPQVAKNIRIIIVETEDGPQPFINPRVIWKSLKREIGEEGCLSIPDVYGLVRRSKSVIVIYLDRQGNKKRLKAKGLMARVLLHEIDHLNGVLFTDRMVKQTSGDKIRI